MGAGHNGHAVCRICGSQLVMKSLNKRSMMGLCKAWRNRHEIACAKKTPAQRRAWAKKYADLEYGEGSMSADWVRAAEGSEQRQGRIARRLDTTIAWDGRGGETKTADCESSQVKVVDP